MICHPTCQLEAVPREPVEEPPTPDGESLVCSFFLILSTLRHGSTDVDASKSVCDRVSRASADFGPRARKGQHTTG